jgi:hypothetical protein
MEIFCVCVRSIIHVCVCTEICTNTQALVWYIHHRFPSQVLSSFFTVHMECAARVRVCMRECVYANRTRGLSQYAECMRIRERIHLDWMPVLSVNMGMRVPDSLKLSHHDSSLSTSTKPRDL